MSNCLRLEARCSKLAA